MVPDTTPTTERDKFIAAKELGDLLARLRRENAALVAQEGRLNMEINTALSQRDDMREALTIAVTEVGVLQSQLDECRDRGMAVVAELRSRGWTGEVEDL